MSRSVVELVERFGTSLGPGHPIGAAKETDFVYRACRAGVPVLYDLSIVVFHYHERRDVTEVKQLQSIYSLGDAVLAWCQTLGCRFQNGSSRHGAT